MQTNHIIIINLGGQCSQELTKSIRSHGVYCEIVSSATPCEDIFKKTPKGIILCGDDFTNVQSAASMINVSIYEAGIPVLGVCGGMQLMSYQLGGQVEKSTEKKDARSALCTLTGSSLFAGLDEKQIQAWMDYENQVVKIPSGFEVFAKADSIPIAAIANEEKNLYGIRFCLDEKHLDKNSCGLILENFVKRICGCEHKWNMKAYVASQVELVRKQVGDKKVLCALSGGVDSAVAALIVHKAIGEQLTCVFVDNGLMRKGEPEQVEDTFKKTFGINLIHAKAATRFLTALTGVTEPETKRKLIGEEFIRLFEEEANKIGGFKFLVQGTIYPDVIESGAGVGSGATIKSHHNVGGLPKDMDFQLIEPLRLLFKDEVRIAGEELGLPKEIVWRQPFPGPGLAIRILGEVTKDKLGILREADYIVRDEIKTAGLDKEIWQAFAVLPSVKSVGISGGLRTYAYPIIVRAVTSDDAMTASWFKMPYDLMDRIANRIINEVDCVNRVVYDITSKPPGTIEWE